MSVTEFDSIKGRGGDDGTPNRKTPWGEIAYQLAGEQGFKVVEEHEKQMVAPAGDVIRKFIPKDKPCLILIDELMNYISRNRKSGLATQLYNFIQNLSEEARGSDRIVLVASIPASELEMTADDQSDYKRFKKMLDRLGKAVIMSTESETSEIIRRRLFEWDPRAVNQDGKILLPREATEACREYADWVADHRKQLPNWFADHAQETFESTYPFHPMVLSVFEKKWQELPRFQRTRGILRLLALWVSHAYQKGFKGALKEPLIGQGSAPLEDDKFRAVVFEQLGESRLEGALTTDICGKKGSHAVRLDAEAVDTIKKSCLHKKVATVIFFESNGGQSRQVATIPEIRMAVSEPDLDIGNVETVLDALTDACYYLTTETNQYRFSLKENLNKRFADRRAGVKDDEIDEKVQKEIQNVFAQTEGIERIFFPDKSGQIPDRPVISMVVMKPDQSLQDNPKIQQTIETMTKEYGKSARTFKSALIWVVADSSNALKEDARKLIAWGAISDEGLNFDDVQKRQLDKNLKSAKSSLKESVWRSYKNVMLLGKDNTIQTIDIGLPTSSSADSLTVYIKRFLRQSDLIVKDITPRLLTKNWPPAFNEWSTKSVRDVFYASPQFPRLLNQDALKQAIARGSVEGYLAYVGKAPNGNYSPFIYKKSILAEDVEISDDMFIITSEEAEKHIKPPQLTKIMIEPSFAQLKPGTKQTFTAKGIDQFGHDIETGNLEWSATGGDIGPDGVYECKDGEGNYIVKVKSGIINSSASIEIRDKSKPKPIEPVKPKTLKWTGEITPQKWMNLYTKVLTKFVKDGSLKLNVDIVASPTDGVSDNQVEETKAALRELGLNDDVEIE